MAPQVSGRLREVAMALAHDSSAIVSRAARVLVEQDETYANLPSSVMLDVREALAFSAHLWLKTIIEGKLPNDDELRIFSESGRRRVHQGVSLTSFLRALRLGSRELWASLLERVVDDAEAREELLYVFSPYLLDYFDRMAQQATSAYLDEQFQRARWRDAMRYELLSIIFSFPDDATAFTKAAEALGLDPAASRVALAMDIELPEVLPSRMEAELDRLLLTVSRSLKIDANDLVRTLHRDRFVVWIPCARGDSVLATDQHMRRCANELVASITEIRSIGAGLMNHGARGWSQSLAEAIKALESGRRLGHQGRVFLYSDIVLNESVLRTDNALRYLDALIERLSHEQDLLLTLSVFLDLGQHRKQVASSLGIHPNTLNYRLARIEDILGAKLDHPGWLARLYIAIRLRRGSGSATP